MSTIGTNIRKRREKLGMTQEELANKLGYKSKSTINKIEMGINDITQSKILLFANALNSTPAYLMGWDNPGVQAMQDALDDIELNRLADGQEGLINILKDIYGHAKMEELNSKYLSTLYFSIGTGQERFAISEHNFDKLYELTKNSISQFIELMKADESKEIQECLESINSEKSIKRVMEYIEEVNKTPVKSHISEITEENILEYLNELSEADRLEIITESFNKLSEADQLEILNDISNEYDTLNISDQAEIRAKLGEFMPKGYVKETQKQLQLNAAHERTDIEVTDEMKKHDDDIMNDDSEWE